MTVINTNAASLITQAALNKNSIGLQKTMESLSTGKRINSAADDAAGLAISSKMTAQLQGLNQAVRNANDGISLIQTAEGSTQEITNMLQRMRELAVQSMNDTYSPTDRSSMNTEYQQLLQEMGRIANTTKWSNFSILNGQGPDGSGSEFQFKVGSDNTSNAATFGGGAIGVGPLYRAGSTYKSTTITFNPMVAGDTVQIGGLTFTASANVTGSAITGLLGNLTPSSTIASLNALVAGSGTFSGTIPTGYNFSSSGTTLIATATQIGSNPTATPLTVGASSAVPTYTTSAGSVASAEINHVTFHAVKAGDTIAINGLTFTANASIATNDLADLFSNIDGNVTLNDLNTAAGLLGSFTGTLTGWTSGPRSGSTVDFTANTNSLAPNPAFSIAADATDPVVLTTAGVDGSGVYTNTATVSLDNGSLQAGNVFTLKLPIAGRSSPLTIDVAIPQSQSNGDFSVIIQNAINSAGASASVAPTKLPMVQANGTNLDFVYSSMTLGDIPTSGTVELGSAPNSIITVRFPNFDPMSADGPTSGVNNTDLLNSANSNAALSKIDAAIDSVNTERSTMGAKINRLQFSVANSTNIVTHLSESRSRIEDVDYSQATSDLARRQIIQQAATAMLAQANQSPQTVLQLLKQ